ncbi:MAG: hypothetical protein JWP43_2591 [Ramlibacter sp.]|jgi:hypothetical protein|nr:hypothetical protein [Ramlibacter sp.]
MFKKILIASLIATSFASAPVISSAATRAIVITQAPPAPRQEVVPAPRRGYEWAPGYWAWRGGRHAWVAGHWVRERRGSHWVPEQWVERNGHWEMRSGRWERGGRADNDRDGVPNRLDSRPNNPNRS